MSKEPHSRRPPAPPVIPPPQPKIEKARPAIKPRPARPPMDRSRRLNRIGLAVCGGFVLLFIILSFSAVRGKSATYDEPLHGLAAWINFHRLDFRINFEDPPLWKYFAALPTSSGTIAFNEKDEVWTRGILDSVYSGWQIANRTLYQTPGNDGAAFINRERFMMVLLGAMLGGVIALWSWRLAGPVAAMIAAGLFALDPTLLGHAGMIKNDVPMALLMAAVFLTCWHVGNKLTYANAAILCGLVAIAVNTKFSALLLAPMLILIVAVRAALPIHWPVLGKPRTRVTSRAIAGAALLAAIALVSYAGIWASYGFRYSPTSDPAISLNTYLHKYEALSYGYKATHPYPDFPAFDPATPLQQQVDELREEGRRFRTLFTEATEGFKTAPLTVANKNMIRSTIYQPVSANFTAADGILRQATSFLATAPPLEDRAANYGQQYAQACRMAHEARGALFDGEYALRQAIYFNEVGDEAPNSFIRFLNVFLDHHLLPSAWLNGVLFVHARSMFRSSFLLGQTSTTGWWYYFPLAALFKTPVATLLTWMCSLVIGVWFSCVNAKHWKKLAWPLACLLVPFVVYMYSAMSSNLNIGIRHIIPAFPLAYITCGVLLAIAIERWKRPIIIAVAAVGLMLLSETLIGYPNYIAYFNFVFHGKRMDLLADSNLDWGQDLPLLAKWQKNHPDVPLAFGPWARQEGVPGSYFGTVDPGFYGIKSDPFYYTKENPPNLKDTHVLAVSATLLQAVYSNASYKTFFRDKTPIEIFGDTIYLYDLRPKQ